jgi:spore coat polysaccharide biosynthesis protein SpsF
MTTTAVIVQARMQSSRLPNKVMLKLANHTVLQHVLDRCASISGVDLVCCATTDGTDTDIVAAEAKRCNAEVFRGSQEDVLDRYYQSAKMVGADIILRVTSDCPLIDPHVCSSVLNLLKEKSLDYACNNMSQEWPHGLDCEAFTFSQLEQAAQQAIDPFEREHVTPWIRNNQNIKKASLPGPKGKFVKQRWTLDFPEDYEFLQAIFSYLPPLPAIPNYKEVMAILTDHPEIASLNQNHLGVSRPK